MKVEEMDDLLKKYYKGETSHEEERILVGTKDKREDSELIKAMETYLMEQSAEQVSDGFDDRIRFAIQEERKNGRLRWSVLTGIAAAFLLIVFISVLLTRDNAPGQYIADTTAADITLPDGSQVVLNKKSQLTIDESFNNEERRVTFTGEAYFIVMHDPDRPFVIFSNGTLTEVLGTEFNLRGYATEGSVELTVVSGKVAFSVPGRKQDVVLLEKDETAIFNTIDNKINMEVLQNINTISWKTGRLHFDNTRLDKVVQDVERYFDVNIEMMPPSLGECHFMGKFTDPTLEEVLRVLSFTMQISYEKNGENYIISGQGCIAENP